MGIINTPTGAAVRIMAVVVIEMVHEAVIEAPKDTTETSAIRSTTTTIATRSAAPIGGRRGVPHRHLIRHRFPKVATLEVLLRHRRALLPHHLLQDRTPPHPVVLTATIAAHAADTRLHHPLISKRPSLPVPLGTDTTSVDPPPPKRRRIIVAVATSMMRRIQPSSPPPSLLSPTAIVPPTWALPRLP